MPEITTLYIYIYIYIRCIYIYIHYIYIIHCICIYTGVSTCAMQGIPFCQILGSEIQIFKNLFLLTVIVAAGCINPEE